METRSVFESLISIRNRSHRVDTRKLYLDSEASAAGVSPYVTTSSTAKTGRPSRHGWIAAAATVAVGVIGISYFGFRAGEQVGVSDLAGVGADGPVQSGEFLAILEPPESFTQSTSSLNNTPAQWPGPAGDLTVFQLVSDNGATLSGVIAIGRSEPGERTALDVVTPGMSEPTAEQVGSTIVTFGRSQGRAQAVETFGYFDLATWSTGETTYTVASRNVVNEDLRNIIGALLIGTPPGELGAAIPALADFDHVPADPLAVPTSPLFMPAQQEFERGDGVKLFLGTAVGEWPKAEHMLWWVAGGQMADPTTIQIPGGVAFRVFPNGAASVWVTPSSEPAILSESLASVREVPRTVWETQVGPLEEGAATTTSTAPN